MLPKYHPRFLHYISGFFPESFRVEVTFTLDDNEVMAIDIATPAGEVARCVTTETQALDVMAMGVIAQELKMRVGMRDGADQLTSARSSAVSLSSISSSAERASSVNPLCFR